MIVKVFDILGNEMETLVNEESLRHLCTWDASSTAGRLSSGVYSSNKSHAFRRAGRILYKHEKDVSVEMVFKNVIPAS